MSEQFDVIIIGSGPGGYVCAIRCAQLGLKTACVEKRDTLGGTCLNVGCIPSKAMLAASENYEAAGHHFAEMGIKTSGVQLDLKTMMGHKHKTVEANVKGVEFLFKKNKVTWLKGEGTVKDAETVAVKDAKGKSTTYKTSAVVIATGSDVASLPGIDIDEKKIVSSTGALELAKVPKHLVVIGGGYIGLEMGTVWRRLGSEVTVVEYLDRALPGMDGEISKEAKKILEKQGIKFKLSTKVTGVKNTKAGVDVTVEPAAGGDGETIKANVVLVAVGRKPHTDKLGLDKAGVKMDERGRVEINEHFETSVPGIYAIGDVVIGPMLAHKAEEEGVAVAEILGGESGHVNYDVIPGVVYTWPEVAQVGQTEEQLKDAGVKYKKGKFPFSANGRARAMGETDGFVKILADAETDRVLGAHIIGPEAGTLIAEIATAMEFAASSEDVFRTCHAHPTLNEVVKEAALAVHGRPIHM
ncbi:MAG: dihydrolipoyl dehydrogenase [Alphaproteobacteria bacterium]|nr:dihydrolipoyl dehydrogenase [Alphaproteobacteria bacterium SS10]